MSDNVKSVQRALYILSNLASNKDGATASEIARELGVNRSTAFRLMETLIDQGFVRQSASTKRYLLTMKLFSLGSKLLEQMDIRAAARGVLEELREATGHTVHFGLRDLNEVVYIDKIPGTNPIQMYSMIGRRAPLYCTGLGKAILAFLKDAEIKEFLTSTELKRYSPNTITDPDRLWEEIMLIRKRGYALDNEEHEQGIECVACPILGFGGEVMGSISVAAVSITLKEKSIEDYSGLVLAATKRINHSLGHKNI